MVGLLLAHSTLAPRSNAQDVDAETGQLTDDVITRLVFVSSSCAARATLSGV